MVDTPGTGSVQLPNTEEAQRAREVLEVAVLDVSVDPPVSAAELDLLAEAHERAARAAMVVNKVDLVDPADVAEVVGFTQRVVSARIGEIPIFPLSARPQLADGSAAGGLDAFLSWLDAQVVGYGAKDAARSARQLLRRHANERRHSVRIERELRMRQRSDDAATRDAVRGILDRSHDRAAAAADRLTGGPDDCARSWTRNTSGPRRLPWRRPATPSSDACPSEPISRPRNSATLCAEISDAIRACLGGS